MVSCAGPFLKSGERTFGSSLAVLKEVDGMESLRIPLSGAQIMEDDVDAVVRALKSGRIAMGPEIRGFEEGLAAVAGVRHAVACSSGTAALHVMLIALGVGPGTWCSPPPSASWRAAT